jgi:hypothetical protein
MRIPFHFVFSKHHLALHCCSMEGKVQDRNGRSDEIQACSLDHTITDRILFCLGFVQNNTRYLFSEPHSNFSITLFLFMTASGSDPLFEENRGHDT